MSERFKRGQGVYTADHMSVTNNGETLAGAQKWAKNQLAA